MKGGTKEERRESQAERDRAMDEKLRADYFDDGARKKRRKNIRIGFCICLALLLVASLVNWGVITNWGAVRIERVNITGDDAATYSALVYVPNNATDETPAPAIICFHGNAGNGRNHESWAMEFARRGFVVVSPDLYGSGDSQGYFDGGERGPTTDRGLFDEADAFYQYLLALPFVDTENVISSGHSMGTNPAQVLGAKYDAAIVLSVSHGGKIDYGEEYKELWANYQGNFVDIEGFVETTDSPSGTGRSDVMAEGLAFLQKYPGYENATEFEPNTVYGSFEEGNGFAYLVEPDRIHEAAFVSTQTIGHLLEYGQLAIGDAVPNYIDHADQIWPIKDYIGLFGVFAFTATLFALTLLLIEEVSVFGKVRRPLPRNVGFRGKGLVVATIIALLIPYLVIKTDAFGLVGGKYAANLRGAGFNMGFANMGFGVVLGLSIVCLIGLCVFVLLERKKKGLKLTDFGLTPAEYNDGLPAGKKISAIVGMVLRSALLAAVVVAAGWVYLQLQLEILGTDFYAWFFGVKDLPVEKIQYYLPYLGVFIIGFIVLSIDMNVQRRLPTTGNETKDLIIAMVVNVLIGIAAVVVIVAVKWALQTAGDPADANWLWSMGLDTQRIWGLPVGMTVACAGSTLIYRKTGNIWLCALLIGTVACLMGMLYGQTRFHYLTYYYG